MHPKDLVGHFVKTLSSFRIFKDARGLHKDDYYCNKDDIFFVCDSQKSSYSKDATVLTCLNTEMNVFYVEVSNEFNSFTIKVV